MTAAEMAALLARILNCQDLSDSDENNWDDMLVHEPIVNTFLVVLKGETYKVNVKKEK